MPELGSKSRHPPASELAHQRYTGMLPTSDMGSSQPRRSRSVVFVRVGRLKHYDTRLDTEGPVGGGSFNDDDVGSEVDNFHPYRGRVYGYAQTPSRSGFNLKRVGPCEPDAKELTGALVVMVALSESGHGQVVVGWYQDAVVMRHVVDRPGGIGGAYNFWTRTSDAVLLPISRRSWKVPKGRGAFGQANVFYTRDANGEPRTARWADGILRRVARYDGPNLLLGEAQPPPKARRASGAGAGQGRSLSATDRKLVETRAMKMATKYFGERRYRVSDMSKHASYDLLCERSGEPDLRVEVKGTTGAGAKVILTANEVESAREHRTALVVVSDIELTKRGGRRVAKGGNLECFLPWKPRKQDLRATQYECVVPRKRR